MTKSVLLTIFLSAALGICAAYLMPITNKNSLEHELLHLKIQEKKLNIQTLKKEISE